MSAKDIYHDIVKRAMIKDGWTITHDPFRLKIGAKWIEADLAAERLIRAEKGTQKILVEIKSFLGRSDIKDLEQAVGQYVLYEQHLQEQGIARELFLAVPVRAFESVFRVPVGMVLLKRHILKLLVYDPQQEVITQWIIQ